MYKVGDQYRGSTMPEMEIIRDPKGILRTRGCPTCDGTHTLNGEDCPRCFDPARYDCPGDAVPRQGPDGEWFRAVAQVPDVSIRIQELTWAQMTGQSTD